MNTAMITTVNEWTRFWMEIGFAHFIQLMVLAVILGLVDVLLGKRLGPGWRSALWLIFFVKLFLPPSLSFPTSPAYWWSPSSVRAEFSGSRAGTLIPAEPANEAWTGWPESVEKPVRQGPVLTPGTRLDWTAAVGLAWLAGVLAMGTAILLRHRRLLLALREARPAPGSLHELLEQVREEVGVRTSVGLRLVGDAPGPMVTGLLHPVIYLPRSLAHRFSPEQLHAVLLHEMFHVKRGDLWVALLQVLSRVFFFYHPATWWVNARLTAIREEAVDQAVLSRPTVERRTYSLSLVEAASQCLFPRPNFAIGVIETKKQLKHRIEMILHQARPRRTKLGFRGVFSILLIGLILVPMMPAIAAVSEAAAPSPEFRPIDPEPIKNRVDIAVSAVMEAFNRRDIKGFVGAFDDNPFILAHGAPLITGRGGVTEMYLRDRNLIYEQMQLADRDFCRIGDWIVETGIAGFKFRLSPSAPVMTDPRQFLSIWKEEEDGSLRVKLLSWNKLADIGQLNSQGQADCFEFKGKETAFSTNGDFVEVLAAEESFHQAFPGRDLETASSFYAEGATLILPETIPLHGRAAILKHLQTQPPEQLAIRIEQQPVHVEGNEHHVLVINLFRWTFQPFNSAPPVTIVGKGVHIWERGPDGAWKILFDLPNATAPAG